MTEATVDEHLAASGFDLNRTYVHLDDAGAAVPLPVGEDFWSDIDPRLEQGRLVSRFLSEADWSNWEMHPAGDELILILSGRMTLVMEALDGSTERSDLEGGDAIVVARGTWHTADVPEPCDAVFITPGKGTEHRPRETS